MALLSFLFASSLLFGNVLAGSQDQELTSFIDDIVKAIINGLLSDIIKSIADPLIVSSYEKTFTNTFKLLSGHLGLSNLNVTGVKSTTAKSSLEAASHSFNLSIINAKEIILYCDYDIDLTFLSFIPFYGKGNISATLDGLNVDLDLTADIVIEKPYLKNLEVKGIKLLLGDNTSFNVEGLMNDDDYSELVNALVTEYIQYVRDNVEEAGKEIAALLQALLDYIQKKTNVNIFKELGIDE